MSDLISRSALYAIIDKACDREYGYGTPLAMLNWFKDIVLQQPTIEAVPVVHGEWKYHRKKGVATCTNCSFERRLDDNFGAAIACSNCGASMEV